LRQRLRKRWEWWPVAFFRVMEVFHSSPYFAFPLRMFV
jgi:hypothetical protein